MMYDGMNEMMAFMLGCCISRRYPFWDIGLALAEARRLGVWIILGLFLETSSQAL